MTLGPSRSSPFTSPIIAGFECARLEWQNNRCLLTDTNHLPEADMHRHYETVKAHSMSTARDGLPWWLPMEPRLQAARDAGIQVIWDLNHWWRHEDPRRYARKLVMAIDRVCKHEPFWCCFNETWLHPAMCPGQSREQVIEEARVILSILHANFVNVRLITAEPAHTEHEIEAHAPFAEGAKVLGVNIYPSSTTWSVSDALRAMAGRYPGKRLMISETGLHPDLDRRWQGINCKADWLRYVLDEVEAVRREGIQVDGICLYPIVNTTSWHNHHERWDHGLIREDLSVDPALSAALIGRRAA